MLFKEKNGKNNIKNAIRNSHPSYFVYSYLWRFSSMSEKKTEDFFFYWAELFSTVTIFLNENWEGNRCLEKLWELFLLSDRCHRFLKGKTSFCIKKALFKAFLKFMLNLQFKRIYLKKKSFEGNCADWYFVRVTLSIALSLKLLNRYLPQ